MRSIVIATEICSHGASFLHDSSADVSGGLSADNKLNCACDKSFADDLVSSRCCKYESNLCITIY